MTRVWGTAASAIVLSFVIAGAAQDQRQAQPVPPPDAPKPTTNDPRVGLKPGLRDAGQAARNMELLSSMPKPEGFFDPATEGPASAKPAPPAAPAAAGAPAGTPAAGRGGGGLNFANSDLAFRKADLYIGNFNGFNAYDIESPKKPRLLASIVCPGGQGDVSVYGNLLFMSVEQTRGRIDCGTQGVEAIASPERFRGVRIFDISDIKRPKQIAAVQTCRGSHTHTLLVDPKDKANVYIYGSGTSTPRPGEELTGCSGKDPKEDPNTSLFSIDVIKVPLANPAKAAVVSSPRIFSNTTTGEIAGLWMGGDHGPNTQQTSTTNQCHDITVFPEVGLAAGACSGNGILIDISDPVHPVRLDSVADQNFAYWHSATFNNDGTKVIYTDEWGGGTRPRCRAEDPLTWGADAVFDIVDKKLKFGGYYKMPAAQTEQENCVAHNGSLIPVPGRDIMVQAWYQGGASVFDFTDAAHPAEIAFFDRGPISATNLVTGGYWSTYWYNGQIYGSEIARGLDVFRLTPSEFLSKNEITAATLVKVDELNAQQQKKVSWPNDPVVARAYLDQLTRSKAMDAARIAAIGKALDKKDRKQLGRLATQVAADAASATGRDQVRMKALADVMKGIK
jgi:hypothetical protein